MERIERIIKKLVIIQLIIFLCSQIFFHHYNSFPELRKLALYEGVSEQNITKILETINSP